MTTKVVSAFTQKNSLATFYNQIQILYLIQYNVIPDYWFTRHSKWEMIISKLQFSAHCTDHAPDANFTVKHPSRFPHQ